MFMQNVIERYIDILSLLKGAQYKANNIKSRRKLRDRYFNVISITLTPVGAGTGTGACFSGL